MILSAAIVSCGPSQKPPPATVTKAPPPPPAPKGDTFRLSQQAGAAGQGKVSIRIENEPLGAAPVKPSRKGGAPGKLIRAYVLTEEHSIAGVEPDGTQHVVGKLIDVEAKTDNPKEQKDADALARALSEVKITFDRAARGEISNLDIKDVNKPLDPVTARIVAGSIYGAGRGQIFAADPIEVGQEWTIHSEVPIPAGGNNVLDLSYHYDKKDGSVATCSFTGKSAGESQGAQLTGEMKGSFEFNLMKGAFVRMLVDTKSARDPGAQASTPGSVLRVHVEWEATTPPGATPSASLR